MVPKRGVFRVSGLPRRQSGTSATRSDDRAMLHIARLKRQGCCLGRFCFSAKKRSRYIRSSNFNFCPTSTLKLKLPIAGVSPSPSLIASAGSFSFGRADLGNLYPRRARDTCCSDGHLVSDCVTLPQETALRHKVLINRISQKGGH